MLELKAQAPAHMRSSSVVNDNYDDWHYRLHVATKNSGCHTRVHSQTEPTVMSRSTSTDIAKLSIKGRENCAPESGAVNQSGLLARSDYALDNPFASVVSESHEALDLLHPIDPCNLFVKNLDDNVITSTRDLEFLFARYGVVVSAHLATFENPFVKPSSKGYGFVAFASPLEALAAKTALNRIYVGQKRIFVSWAERRDQREQRLRSLYEESLAHISNIQTLDAAKTTPPKRSPNPPAAPVSVSSAPDVISTPLERLSPQKAVKSSTTGSWDIEQTSQKARVVEPSPTKQISVSAKVFPPVTKDSPVENDVHTFNPKPIVSLNPVLPDADKLSEEVATITDPAVFKASDGNKSGPTGSSDPKEPDSSATGQENLAISHPLGKSAKRRRRKAKLHKMRNEASAKSCEMTGVPVIASHEVADGNH